MKIKAFIKRHKLSIATILGVILVFGLWFVLALIFNTSLFPSPIEAISRMFLILSDGDTWYAIGMTLLRLVSSFLICLLLALLLGTIAGFYPFIKKLLNPLILVLRTIPTAAVIYVLIVLFATDIALYTISFLLMFPILYEAVASGISNIDQVYIDSLKVEQASRSPKTLFKVIYPMSWPYIILGIVQSLGLGMKVSIMAEVLCGSNSLVGIGRLMYFGYIESDMKEVFAVALIAIILIGIVDVLLGILKRKYTKNK